MPRPPFGGLLVIFFANYIVFKTLYRLKMFTTYKKYSGKVLKYWNIIHTFATEIKH
jgi:hypothetical protein